MNRPIVALSGSLLFISVSVLVSSSIASCQDAPLRPPPGMALTTMRFGPGLRNVKPITGAPYCADEVYERVQTLVDGTHITSNHQTIKQCRDSAGRTRREEPVAPGPFGRTESFVLIHIDDPVANVRYILDSEHKIAHRHPLLREEVEAAAADAGSRLPPGATATTILPRGETGTLAPGSSTTTISGSRIAGKSDNLAPHTTSENLGKETVEGVVANGTRTTTTYPVGSVGNDKEFTETGEHWYSAELHLEVLSKTNDPRYGENTHKFINVSTSEPDPSLFQVPEGYTVDNEDQFRIEWKVPPPQPVAQPQ